MIGPGPFEDLTAISTAATTDELWRWLVGNSHLRAAPNTFEALVAWRNLHKDHPQGALETAGLLCTDLRWRRCTAPLIAEIEESGILDVDLLDRLAGGFLWHDHYAWPVPSAWLDDRTVVTENVEAPEARPEPLYLERPIAPPLRRWAARRTARRHPKQAHDILDRVQELDARAGDAVLAGLLDAADGYPADARDSLIELGINWSGAPVRLRALQLLADHGDDHSAATRARGDPNGRIRAWSQRLTRHRPPSVSTSHQGDVTAQTAARDARQTGATTLQAVEQPSLFG
jgi:hypothetical protein